MVMNVGDSTLPPNEASFVLEIRPKEGGSIGLLISQLLYGVNGLLWINEEYVIDEPGKPLIRVWPDYNASRRIWISFPKYPFKYSETGVMLSISLGELKRLIEQGDEGDDISQNSALSSNGFLLQLDESSYPFNELLETDEYGEKIRINIHIKDSGNWNYPPGYEGGVFCNKGMLTRDDLYWFGVGDGYRKLAGVSGPSDYPKYYRTLLREFDNQSTKHKLAYFVNILPQSRVENCINLGDVIMDQVDYVYTGSPAWQPSRSTFLSASYFGQLNAVTIGYVDLINWSKYDRTCALPLPYTDKEWPWKRESFGWRMTIPGTQLVFRVLRMPKVQRFYLPVHRSKYLLSIPLNQVSRLWYNNDIREKLGYRENSSDIKSGYRREEIYKLFEKDRPLFTSPYEKVRRTKMMTLMSELSQDTPYSYFSEAEKDKRFGEIELTGGVTEQDLQREGAIRSIFDYRERYHVDYPRHTYRSDSGGIDGWLISTMDKVNENRKLYRETHPDGPYPNDTEDMIYAKQGGLWLFVPKGHEGKYRWLFDDFHRPSGELGEYPGGHWWGIDRRSIMQNR